jgi:hypothetical protein
MRGWEGRHSIGASGKSRLARRSPLRHLVLRIVLPCASLLLVLAVGVLVAATGGRLGHAAPGPTLTDTLEG